MKTILYCIPGILLNMALCTVATAQCAGGAPPFTISYDTTATGSGNSSRSFTFPQFNPSMGTLLSADISVVSKLQFSYTLENNWFTTQTYKTQVFRSDDIYSTALDPSSIDVTNHSPQLTNVLTAGSHINYGPSTLNSTISNSITDSRLINFEGVGTVNFDFETGTYQLTQNSTHYNFSFTSSTDTTVFKITYRYCSNSVLSSDLLFFTAQHQAKSNVLLNWRQATVAADRIYGVQVSTNGITFSNLADIAEDNTGTYYYNYLNGSASKLFFRIQERNASGDIKYSNIRLVEFNQDTKGSALVFPTLYTGGSLTVHFPEKGDWQVRMYAADGRKLTDSRYEDASAVLSMPGTLGNGVYIIETVNLHSQQRDIARIIIQR